MTTTTFLTAYLLAVLWAVGRATLLYAVGAGLVAGTASRGGRWAGRLARGHVASGAQRVRERGALGVARNYLVPGLCEATQVMAGMSRMPVRSFAAGFLLAALPWAVVDATLGSALVAALTSPWGVALLTLLAGAAGWRHRARRFGRVRRIAPAAVSMPA